MQLSYSGVVKLQSTCMLMLLYIAGSSHRLLRTPQPLLYFDPDIQHPHVDTFNINFIDLFTNYE